MPENNSYFNKILDSCRRFCSKSEKCKYDVLNKLQYTSLNDYKKQEIINVLENEKFIDENRYTKAFVNDKFKFNKWGKIKISHTLRQKNVPDNIIYNNLQIINDDEYRSILIELLNHKKQSIKETDNYKIKAALIRFAVSRGFEYDIINDVLSEII